MNLTTDHLWIIPAALALAWFLPKAKRRLELSRAKHRSLAGHSQADRAELIAAGLDVPGLEAQGRMVFSEISLDITIEDYVHAWEPEMEAALARGFDAAWWARFPIGPDAEIIERSVEYDRAWDDHFHDRPCVSLCLFIVGDVDRDRRAAQLAETHDTVLT